MNKPPAAVLPQLPSVSLSFPVYKDEGTVRTMAEKSIRLLSGLGCPFEIIIVDDHSPDRSGEIADELAKTHDFITVIHHPENRGYGAAIRSGMAASRYDWLAIVDGDDQYDVEDFTNLFRFTPYYLLIITFRYKKIYSTPRIFISWVYNVVFRWLFRTHFRDISTGMRLVHRSVIENVELESNSPFVGAELTIKAMLKGFPIGEVGIQTFPRGFGRGSSTTVPNIMATIRDMRRTYSRVFSTGYSKPPGRE